MLVFLLRLKWVWTATWKNTRLDSFRFCCVQNRGNLIHLQSPILCKKIKHIENIDFLKAILFSMSNLVIKCYNDQKVGKTTLMLFWGSPNQANIFCFYKRRIISLSTKEELSHSCMTCQKLIKMQNINTYEFQGTQGMR